MKNYLRIGIAIRNTKNKIMMDYGYASTILQYLCKVLILLTKIQSDVGIIFWEAGRMPGSQSMTAMPQPQNFVSPPWRPANIQ